MSNVATIKPAQTIDAGVIATLVTKGDLAGLSPQDQVSYYNYRCQQAGLDPAAKPFDLLKLNGKLVLYANASCTQQLCGIHKLKVQITARERIEDIYTVCARVESQDGRSSENMGAVPIAGLKGEALSNALMKATTKAIRRTVLAHVGLGMLDETEADSIPGAEKIAHDPRGDISVDNRLRDKHVSAIADILNADADENQIADMLRSYVADYLQQFQDLYISVADELAAQKIASKAQLKAWLRTGLDRK